MEQVCKTVRGRPLVRIVGTIAEQLGLKFESMSDGWICQLSNDKARFAICGCAFPLNSQAAANIALDKASASAVLQHHRVPHVPHKILYGPTLSYSMARTEREKGTMTMLYEELEQWKEHGLVLKPKNGNSGQGVCRARTRLECEAAWLQHLQKARDLTVSPFFPLLEEYRLMLLDGEMHVCYKKVRQDPEKEWRHNVSLGATVTTQVNSELIQSALLPLARDAMDAIGLRFASVDIVELHPSAREHSPELAAFASPEGFMVMEVNSAVFIDGFLKQCPDQFEGVFAMFKLAVQKSLRAAEITRQ